MTTVVESFEEKTRQIRTVLTKLNTNGVLISLVHNFSWLTAGARNHIPSNTEYGVASFFIDSDNVTLITNNIEMKRLQTEELHGLQMNYLEENWTKGSSAQEIVKRSLSVNKSFILDSSFEFESEVVKLRTVLNYYQMQQFRDLGAECGKIVANAAHQVKRGMTEWEIAGSIAVNCLSHGIEPVVILIAADERIDLVRHPLPTSKKVNKRAMLVLCGRRLGLISSLTRIVYLKDEIIPEGIKKRHYAATYVDAVAMANTKSGVTGDELFLSIQAAYRDVGFEEEWELHHQGGSTGYKTREWKATPKSQNMVHGNEAFAWNPSITGTKSEDTILCHCDSKIEIISNSPDWPMITHTINGIDYNRPDILQL